MILLDLTRLGGELRLYYRVRIVYGETLWVWDVFPNGVLGPALFPVEGYPCSAS